MAKMAGLLLCQKLIDAFINHSNIRKADPLNSSIQYPKASESQPENQIQYQSTSFIFLFFL